MDNALWRMHGGRMKEKIKRFADGSFSYEQPQILLSDAELNISVSAGEEFFGVFTIKNSKSTYIKGLLYSSHSCFILENDKFAGAENDISYRFSATYLDPGEIITGNIDIISECGEVVLPFQIKVEAPYCITSIGNVKDTFQLANLAKVNWLEAKRLFQSKEFRQVLLFYNKKQCLLYDQLMKSSSGSHALEEFLIASNKKKRIKFQLDRTEAEYTGKEESFLDKLVITKDDWGYAEIRIRTDSPFITPDRKLLWTDNFIGNHCELDFSIHPEKMKPGINKGIIEINTAYQQLEFIIICDNIHKIPHEIQKRRMKKQLESDLLQNYIRFRTTKLSASDYAEEAEQILHSLYSLETDTTHPVKDIFYELYRVHIQFIEGKISQAKTSLALLQEDETDWGQEKPHYSGALAYLHSLLKKNAKVTIESCNKLQDLYQENADEWLLLWFLLYMDKRYKSNAELKFDDIKKQFINGCRSPVLYYEAAVILNESSEVLKELGEFELQVICFGVKQNFLNSNASSQVTYLAGREKEYHRLKFFILTKVYERFREKEALTAICSMLIKGQKKEKKYFHWFQSGVQEQIRVTELQEYYLYTADEDLKELPPVSVLHYFQYQSNLSDKKKAMLYANIIRFRASQVTIYDNYKQMIHEFCVEQVMKGRLNRNLALIYDNTLHPEILDKPLVECLSEMMFRNELVCKNSSFKSVCVAHREMEKEVCVPLVDGRAYIDIFTEQPEIMLIDENNNRYRIAEQFTLYKLLHLDFLLPFCYQLLTDYPKLLLHQQNEIQYKKPDVNGVEICQKVVNLTGLEHSFLSECEQFLVNYYYDNFQGEALEKQLLQIDFKVLHHAERVRMIELLLIRDLYNLALAAMQEYGYEGVGEKRILRLCSRLIPDVKEEYVELIKALAFQAFCKRKFDEVTLKFLADHYDGSTDSMFELWSAAKEADLEVIELEERLLGQVLFAETLSIDAIPLFRSYYYHGTNRKLIRACLSYYAYKYLINDRIFEVELFDIMKKEATYEENNICMLAVLKNYSTQQRLTDAEVNFVDYQLRSMEQKNLILPFFKDFKDTMRTPRNMYDKYYIEYRTHPDARVKIHYFYDNCDSAAAFQIEEMYNVCYGIFVKEFIIFYNEPLQYYIEEELDGVTSITESKAIRLKPELIGGDDTKYHQLNLVITAKEMNDDVTVVKLLESYVKTDYCISQLFHPLVDEAQMRLG